MNNSDHWLLQPSSSSTYPTTKENLLVGSGLGPKDLNIVIQHPKVPQSDSNESDIVLYVPGWTEFDLAPCRNSTAIRGTTAASISHPRDGAIQSFIDFVIASPQIVRNWKHISDSVWHAQDINIQEDIVMSLLGEFENSGTISRKKLVAEAMHAGQRRQENILLAIQTLAEEGYRVHLYGHSLGGIDATMAITEAYNMIRSLGLLGTGGLLNDDSANEILPRVLHTAIDEAKEFAKSPISFIKIAVHSLRFVLENPVLTIREGQYAVSGRLHQKLGNLVFEHSIPIINVLGEDDKMFPTQRVLEDTRDNLFADTVIIPKAGHNFTRDQSGGVALIAINAANDLRLRTSSRLEAQLHNKKERQAKKNSWSLDIDPYEIDEELGANY